MKKLEQFKSSVVTQDELVSVKGGIRLITENKHLYNRKKDQLQMDGINFMHEKISSGGSYIYCIEW